MNSITIVGGTPALLKQNILAMAALIEGGIQVVSDPNQSTFDELAAETSETTSAISVSDIKKDLENKPKKQTKKEKNTAAAVASASQANPLTSVSPDALPEVAASAVEPTILAKQAAGTLEPKKSEGASAPSTDNGSSDPFGMAAPVAKIAQQYTRDQLTATINAFLEHEKGGMEKAVAIFASVGAKKMSDITDNQIDSVINMLKNQVNGVQAAAPNLLS